MYYVYAHDDFGMRQNYGAYDYFQYALTRALQAASDWSDYPSVVVRIIQNIGDSWMTIWVAGMVDAIGINRNFEV